MIARSTRILLEVVAGVLAVAVLLALVAFWRLTSGPVQIDFLTPRIEAALADPESGLAFEVGRTELTWAAERRSIDFRTHDVRVRGGEDGIVAVLPEVAIQLSLRALLHGTFAPTAVEVFGARVGLVRGPEGALRLDRRASAPGDGAVEADFSQVLPAVIAQLMAEPAVDNPLSFLTVFRIVEGRLWIDDRSLGRTWRAPLADIELRRDAAGLAGSALLTVDLGPSQAEINAGFVYDQASDRIDASGDFTGVRAEAIVSLVPRLAELSGLMIAFDGTVSAALRPGGAVENLHFELSGADGRLELPGVLPTALRLPVVRARGRMRDFGRRLELDLLDLRLGGAETAGPSLSGSVTLSAAAPGFGGDLTLAAEVRLEGLPVAELEHYWPDGVGGGGRDWVARNLPGGTVTELEAEAALTIPADRAQETALTEFGGRFRFRDLPVHFLRPMPPVVVAAGSAVFDRRSITFTPEAGSLAGLELRGGEVEISGLDQGKETVRVEAAVEGPLRDGLELLDHERLGLVRKLDLEAAAASGQAATRMSFRFPIHVPTTLDSIDVTAEARLEHAELRDFLLGHDVTEGRLALTVDKAAMEVRGPLRFGGVPMDVVWSERFDGTTPERTRIAATIPRLDDADRKALGIDLAPYLDGPVAAQFEYRGGAETGTLDARLDLAAAALKLAPLHWRKDAGRPGDAAATVRFADGRPVAIDRLAVDAATLRARGTARFDASGAGLSALSLEELRFNNTKLRDVAVAWPDAGVELRLGAGVLDAEPFLAEDAAPEAPEAAPAARQFSPLALSAPRLERVYFGPDRFLEGAAVELRRGARGWERVAVWGEVPKALWSPEPEESARPSKPLDQTTEPGEAVPVPRSEPAAPEPANPLNESRSARIDFGPAAEGRYRFLVEADDMGAALRALDQHDTIHGGRLVIDGTTAGPIPTHPLTARIEAHDYILREAPTLARLLTVASLTGIGDLLDGEGIRFDRLVGEFTFQDGVMTTDLIRAYGAALGITAQGEIDFDRSRADLRGTLVPAYSVNRVLGEIPLLGPVLTGGEGQGFLAVTYEMTGDLEDPEVNVDPLSALAPGFLRGLFTAQGGEGEDERPQALPPDYRGR